MPTTQKAAARRFALVAAEHIEQMGLRIKQARFNRGWTQEELARQMGGKVTGTAVSRWERGANRPHDDSLERLAEVLGVSVASFMADPPRRDAPRTFKLSEDRDDQLDRIEAAITDLSAQVELIASMQRKITGSMDALASMRPAPMLADLIDESRRAKQALEARLSPEAQEAASDSATEAGTSTRGEGDAKEAEAPTPGEAKTGT